MIVGDITIPVINGPTKEELERAIEAIERAEKVKNDFFAKAAEKGEHPYAMDDLTSDYYCTILTGTRLSWKLNGRFRFINYRLSDQVEHIRKQGDRYFIRVKHHNSLFRRTLVASPKVSYTLHPGSDYTFDIVYDPETMIGRVYRLSLCASDK